VYDKLAVGELPVVLRTRVEGQVILGGGFWLTLMLNVQLDRRLALSNAVHVTTLAPRGKLNPDGGEQLAFLTPEPSLTLNEYATAMDEAPFGLTFIEAGQVSLGGVVSSIRT
jgi:hypothetical protein